MSILKNAIKHFNLVSRHRFVVFKLSIKAGIPVRGFLHDLSKYSITEFSEGVKYFNGKKSPIVVCRAKNGYSEAWIHHKGRNKHHIEYWVDNVNGDLLPIFLPYKYMVEMICDRIAAGIIYEGKNWTKEEPLEYWIKSDKPRIKPIHPGVAEYIETVLGKLSKTSIKETLNKKYLKNTYIDIAKKYNINAIE